MARLPAALESAITPGLTAYAVAARPDLGTVADQERWLREVRDYIAAWGQFPGQSPGIKYYEYSRAEIFKPYLTAEALTALDVFVGRIATEPV